MFTRYSLVGDVGFFVDVRVGAQGGAVYHQLVLCDNVRSESGVGEASAFVAGNGSASAAFVFQDVSYSGGGTSGS